MEILIAVCITYFVLIYIIPILDLLLQLLNYKISDKANEYQLATQAQVKEFEKLYPSTEERSPAIGFHLDNPNVCDDESEDKIKKNKMGFRIKN
jgi:hypothetical protein